MSLSAERSPSRVHSRKTPETSQRGAARKTRIFWCHPMLTDYRIEMFRRVANRHDVRFFFQQRPEIPNPFPSVYGRDNAIRSEGIPGLDLREIWRGIAWCDVFISSFIWSSYTRSGLAFARLLGRKVIVWEEINDLTLHDVARRDPRYGLSGLVRLVFSHELKSQWPQFRRVNKFRFLARLVDAFYVLGGLQAEALVRLGVPRDRIFQSNEYPGHRYSEITPSPFTLPVGESAPVFLYLGRLVEIKGVEYLIRAFSRLCRERSDAGLLIVGEGPDRPRLEDIVRREEVPNVHFLGPVKDVPRKAFLFTRSSAVVVPSVTLHGAREGGPLVVLEALSAGTPVVGTDALGSSTALVRDGINGYAVAEKDSEALYEAMKRVLGPGRISRDSVLRSFEEIRGYDYQEDQLDRAVAFVTGRS